MLNTPRAPCNCAREKAQHARFNGTETTLGSAETRLMLNNWTSRSSSRAPGHHCPSPQRPRHASAAAPRSSCLLCLLHNAGQCCLGAVRSDRNYSFTAAGHIAKRLNTPWPLCKCAIEKAQHTQATASGFLSIPKGLPARAPCRCCSSRRCPPCASAATPPGSRGQGALPNAEGLRLTLEEALKQQDHVTFLIPTTI